MPSPVVERSPRQPSAASLAIGWHDTECGSYRGDLPLWLDLADRFGTEGVLDLGCGTGRVALVLARAGHSVTALDSDGDLLAALAERAGAAGVIVEPIVADARDFSLDRRFGLILAPMQVAQLLGGKSGRVQMIEAIAAHLTPGGLAAIALAGPVGPGGEGASIVLGGAHLVPDVLERPGFRFVSTPVAMRDTAPGLWIERRRELHCDGGETTLERASILLDRCPPGELEQAGARTGLEVGERLIIPETDDHVGSIAVVLSRPS